MDIVGNGGRYSHPLMGVWVKMHGALASEGNAQSENMTPVWSGRMSRVQCPQTGGNENHSRGDHPCNGVIIPSRGVCDPDATQPLVV